jgi:hypothetical protein
MSNEFVESEIINNVLDKFFNSLINNHNNFNLGNTIDFLKNNEQNLKFGTNTKYKENLNNYTNNILIAENTIKYSKDFNDFENAQYDRIYDYTRQQRAYNLLINKKIVMKIRLISYSKNFQFIHYVVSQFNNNIIYPVYIDNQNNNNDICGCIDNTKTKLPCKHIIAVRRVYNKYFEIDNSNFDELNFRDKLQFLSEFNLYKELLLDIISDNN